jgi:succinate dehydrogenase hydrophobic membrane anchor protein
MGIRKRGFWPWFLQRISALILIVGMSVHIVFLPLSGQKLDFMLVNNRLAHLGWLIFDLILLTACLYHGLNGSYNVIMDYNPSPKVSEGVKYALIALGALFFILGVALLKPFSVPGGI